MKTPKRVNDFSELINFLLKNKSKKIEISFKETLNDEGKSNNASLKKSYNKSSVTRELNNPYLRGYVNTDKGKKVVPAKFTSSDDVINKWMIEKLFSAVNSGDIELTMGHQLYKSKIICDIKTKKELFELNVPIDAYELDDKKTIWTDAILEVCIPVLNYLNNEGTLLEKGYTKLWSSDQLTFLIELLILIGYYSKDSTANYEFGRSQPSTADKNYLYTTLQNKLKSRKLQIINPMESFVIQG